MNICGLKLPLSLDPNLTEALASSASMTASSTSLFNSLPLSKKINPNNNIASINGNKLNSKEGNNVDNNNACNSASTASKSKYS